MATRKKADDAATITVKGRQYDVNKDFSWRELMTVEELSGLPLGRDGALDNIAVGAAFIFVILKREETELTWEGFLDSGVSDIAADAPSQNGNGASSEKRPTKAAKAA